MKPFSRAALTLTLSLLASLSPARAAPAPYLMLDHSTSTLIEPAVAKAMIKAAMPTNLNLLYPVAKWGFVSQVEGGFDDAKVCVVTARVMLLPRKGKSFLFEPAKTATTFGSRPDATAEQCQTLAKGKLAESIEALRFAVSGH